MAQKKITAIQVDVASIEAGLDIDNLVPAQTGNSGKVLGTDGTNVSWVDQTGGGGGTFADGSVAAPSITFTNDTTTGFYNIGGGNIGVAGGGEDLAKFTTWGTGAKNHLIIQSSPSGNGPTFSVDGPDTNISASFYAKGTGSAYFGATDGTNYWSLLEAGFGGTPDGTSNYVYLGAGPTTTTPTIASTGTDTDVGLYLTTKGTGTLVLGADTSLEANKTLSLGDGTLIRGNFANAVNSAYFQSNSGNDTYLRLKANNKTATSISAVMLNGSNDIANTVQVLLRARGDDTATATSGIVWQKITAGIPGNPPDFEFVSHTGSGYAVVAAIPSTGVVSQDNHIVTSGHLQYNLGLSGFEGMLGADTLEMHNLSLEPKVAGKDNYDSSLWMFSNVDGDLGRHHLAIACDTFTGGSQQALISLKNAPYIGDANPSTIPIIIQNEGGGEIWVGESGSTIQMKTLPVEFHQVPFFNAGISEVDVVADNQLVNKKYVDDAVAGAGGASLPDQTGNSGKFLTTDGTNASWATVSGGGGGSTEMAGVNFPSADTGVIPLFAAPSPITHKTFIWEARNNSTTTSQQYGWQTSTLTTSGTAGAVSRSTNSVSTAGQRLFRMRYTSSASANAIAGLHSGTAAHGIQQSHFEDYGFVHMYFRFNINDTETGARMLVGHDTTLLGNNEPSTFSSFGGGIYLGADSTSTNLFIAHRAANATPTVIDLGANFPKSGTNIGYEVALFYVPASGYPTSAKWYVKNLNTGDVATGTATSNVAGPYSTTMNYIQLLRGTSAAAAVVIEPSLINITAK